MPTYEYSCACGHSHDEMHPMAKAPTWRKCPDCGKRALRQVGTGSSPIFKGPGFHCNDYPGPQGGKDAVDYYLGKDGKARPNKDKKDHPDR